MLTFYGVLILSKYPCKCYEHLFPVSRMGRSIVFCEALINGEPILVSTVHLESLDNTEIRID
jgi:endonuclease/exonuclease/phosphatase family metal-dependent hydrolase